MDKCPVCVTSRRARSQTVVAIKYGIVIPSARLMPACRCYCVAVRSMLHALITDKVFDITSARTASAVQVVHVELKVAPCL